MRSRISSRLLAAAAALTLASPLPAAAQLIPTQLTFFGDSFTDGGNGDILSALFGLGDLTPSPPYAPGVITNGPNWANYFSSALGLALHSAPSLAGVGGRNHAIGTARTGALGGGGFPIGMGSQVQNYVAGGNPTQATGLVVLFGGALDVFDAALIGSQAGRTAALGAAAQNIAAEVAALYATGARHFLVPSIPNVGLSPRGLAGGPQASALLGALTAEFNMLVAGALAAVQPAIPGANVMGLRLDNLFHNILADAATGGTRYGLTNATLPCFAFPVPCGASVFVDDLHPTTVAHALIADAALARVVRGVDVSAVPEPATIALVGGGLLMVGAAARKRRRA